MLLVDTAGLNAWVTSVSHGGRTSRLNFLSATVCVDIAEMLLRPDRPEFEPGARPRVLICSPYRPQMKLLTLLLRDQQLAGEVNAGTAHTFQGNEAPVMPEDVGTPLHRNLGVHITRGTEPWRILANYLGRLDGPSRGRDGNVHFADLNTRERLSDRVHAYGFEGVTVRRHGHSGCVPRGE